MKDRIAYLCKNMHSMKVMILFSVLIIFFDAIGGMILVFDKNPSIQKKLVRFNELIYFGEMENSSDRIYYEMLFYDEKEPYRIEFDNIKFFENEKFNIEVDNRDTIQIYYVEKKKYFSVLGIEKNGTQYFSQEASYLVDSNHREWRNDINISKYILGAC